MCKAGTDFCSAHILNKKRVWICMRLRELQEKNVINMKNCKCLGNVVDLDLDDKDGCIRALILPGPGHFFGIFCREYELFIPWCDVKKIGPEIILVDVDEKEVTHKL